MTDYSVTTAQYRNDRMTKRAAMVLARHIQSKNEAVKVIKVTPTNNGIDSKVVWSYTPPTPFE